MRPRGIGPLVLALLLGVLPGDLRAPPAHAAPVGRVERVTLTRAEHGAEIVIRTSRPLRYESAVIDTPPDYTARAEPGWARRHLIRSGG